MCCSGAGENGRTGLAEEKGDREEGGSLGQLVTKEKGGWGDQALRQKRAIKAPSLAQTRSCLRNPDLSALCWADRRGRSRAGNPHTPRQAPAGGPGVQAATELNTLKSPSENRQNTGSQNTALNQKWAKKTKRRK